jgi:hypothetical protein
MSAIINGDSPSVTFSDGTTQATASPSPTTTGNIPFTTNGTSWSSVAKIVSGSATASTSGTSIDFASIPSWVKRITVMFNGVSTNGTSPPQIQLGDAGGIENSGYLSSNFILIASASPVGAAFTAGFGVGVSTGQWASTVTVQGSVTISLLNASTNTWVASGLIGRNDVTSIYVTSGSKSLSDILTTVRITTANGTDTFDAGTINILYE